MPEEKRYLIHNMTRSRETRSDRTAISRERSRTVLVLGGGSVRVMRNRPLNVPESTIRKVHTELLGRVNVGAAKVTTDKGEPVDILTLKALEKVKPVEGPKPHPKQDSLANDLPAGNKMPKMVGGVPEGYELPTPAVGEQAIPEGEPQEAVQKEEPEESSSSKRSRRKKG